MPDVADVSASLPPPTTETPERSAPDVSPRSSSTGGADGGAVDAVAPGLGAALSDSRDQMMRPSAPPPRAEDVGRQLLVYWLTEDYWYPGVLTEIEFTHDNVLQHRRLSCAVRGRGRLVGAAR